MANLIGTGLGLRTRGLESGVDLPATASVHKSDTVAGVAGTLTLPLMLDYWYPCDSADNEDAAFALGAAAYLHGTLTAWKIGLTGVLVTLEVYDMSTWELVPGGLLLDAVSVDLAAGVGKTLKTINGGVAYPNLTLACGEYVAYLTVEHADAPTLQAEITFTVHDLPAVGNVVPPDTVQGVTGTHECSAGEAPAAPTITASATGITVDGAAGATNAVYYRPVAVAPGAWTLLGSRSGDGAVLFGSLAAGKYQFLAVSLSTEYSLPSNLLDYYVGGSTQSIHQRVALDAAGAIEAEAALRGLYLDRQENRLSEILAGGGLPAGRLGYCCFELGRVRESRGPEEYEPAEGELIVNLLSREGAGESGTFELARVAELVVQALDADRSRGGLCYSWWFKSSENTGAIMRPWRAALLRFGYQYGAEPGARVSTS